MYYVFETNLYYWRSHMVQASFQGQILDFKPSWWLDTPFIRPIPPLVFTVSSKAPKPDNFFVSTAFSLFSDRLLKLIEQAGVHFEAIPATILDRKTKQPLPLDYVAFHLLETHPALDRVHSILEEETAILEKLVLTDEALETARPLFRIKEYISVVLIHETLKKGLKKPELLVVYIHL